MQTKQNINEKCCSTLWKKCRVCNDKIDLLNWCLFAVLRPKCQSCFLQSCAHLRRSSHPPFFLKHILQFPSASVSTYNDKHTKHLLASTSLCVIVTHPYTCFIMSHTCISHPCSYARSQTGEQSVYRHFNVATTLWSNFSSLIKPE